MLCQIITQTSKLYWARHNTIEMNEISYCTLGVPRMEAKSISQYCGKCYSQSISPTRGKKREHLRGGS